MATRGFSDKVTVTEIKKEELANRLNRFKVRWILITWRIEKVHLVVSFQTRSLKTSCSNVQRRRRYASRSEISLLINLRRYVVTTVTAGTTFSATALGRYLDGNSTSEPIFIAQPTETIFLYKETSQKYLIWRRTL